MACVWELIVGHTQYFKTLLFWQYVIIQVVKQTPQVVVVTETDTEKAVEWP